MARTQEDEESRHFGPREWNKTMVKFDYIQTFVIDTLNSMANSLQLSEVFLEIKISEFRELQIVC